MINRHPHVFKKEEKSVNTAEELLLKWDELKKKEKGYNGLIDEMKGVTKGLPALLRAHKVQGKARKIGFDFPNVEEALNKVSEETKEVKDVYNMPNVDKIQEEVGDLLFSVVNVARILGIDEEIALNKTIDKFIDRISFIEREAKEQNKQLLELSIEEMDKIWEKSKK